MNISLRNTVTGGCMFKIMLIMRNCFLFTTKKHYLCAAIHNKYHTT